MTNESDGKAMVSTFNYGQIEDFKKAPATVTPEIIVELCEMLQGYMTGAITRKSMEQTMDELYAKRQVDRSA